MTDFLLQVILWLFVVNLGIAFGAGLYESRIMVPQWLVSTASGYEWNGAAARAANTGLRFWVYVTTIPLTVLTLASLLACFWTEAPVRGWWLGATAAALVDRSMTFGYFIPSMIRLMQDEGLSRPKAVSTALQWVRLGYIRHAATLAAWLAALKALTLLSAGS
jgi:hypothetical protein